MEVKRNFNNNFDRLRTRDLTSFFMILDEDVVEFERGKYHEILGKLVCDSINKKYTVTLTKEDEDEIFESRGLAMKELMRRMDEPEDEDCDEDGDEEDNGDQEAFNEAMESLTEILGAAASALAPTLEKVLEDLKKQKK